jgi:hypothetical protein
MMFHILFVTGEGWDDAAQEAIEGGFCLGEEDTLAEALEIAACWRVIAPRQHGEGEVVVVDEDGQRVDRGNRILHPVSVGYTCGQ